MPTLLRSQTELFSESHAGLSSHAPSAPVSVKPDPVLVSITPSYLEALQALGYSESVRHSLSFASWPGILATL
jgi:hypothetical protein